jgi:suppressor for copper-sensitivity B
MFSSISALRRPAALLAGGTALFSALFSGSAAALESEWSRNDHTAVRLISATQGVGTADSLRLGLQVQMQPGWKIYWRSPGDAGFPPRLDWSGSENLADATIRWPAPMRFELFGLDTFGYDGEVVLPIDVKPAQAGAPVRATAKLDYLICEKICIPYEATLALALPAGPAAPSAHAHLIDRFVARVPGDGSGITLERAEFTGGAPPQLSVTAQALTPFAAPDVFVEGPEGWGFGKPVATFSDGGRRALLRMPVAAVPGGALTGKDVTLTLVDGERAAERTLAVAQGTAPAPLGAGLLGVLALALLGGFILNLMPCVLPVLSIKLLNVVSHGGAARGTVRANFLASAAGILASFMVLAGVLVALKSGGHVVGWGIQFQSPAFLIFMTLLLVLFATNLWGWFEIRLPAVLSGAVGSVPDRDDRWGAFVTGAFATLLATPCSAPFLGTAVGFALASGPAEIFAVFAALGLGLALPYLAVAAMPSIAQRMPRPGRWMIVLRWVLGLALLGTAVWLLTVLAVQLGWQGVAALAVLLAALLAFLWMVREAGGQRRALRIAGVATLVAIAFVVPTRFAASPEAAVAEPGWQPWDRAEIDRLVAAGNVVFVDVTADWCITCQVNKSLVLTRGEVAARLAGQGGERIIAMRADWTRPDPRISDYLASFGRYGIPFNVVYGPAAPAGIPLPELLTGEIVLTALDRAAGPAQAAAPAR